MKILDILKLIIGIQKMSKLLVDFVLSKYHKIDLLVNNAGVDLVEMINDTTFNRF